MTDLRVLSGVRVEPHTRRAGVVSHTGAGDLTLGGGGRLMRRYGLTIDSLRSAEAVTADGQSLRMSPGEHADLFWAAGAYGRTLERLRLVKAIYDPDNLFRLNQNIQPAPVLA